MHLIAKGPVEMHPSYKPDFHPTIGREAETATFIKRNYLFFSLRLVGFRPGASQPLDVFS